MSDKLIISNVENYNKTFEFSGIKPYISRYVDIINEYMMYVNNKGHGPPEFYSTSAVAFMIHIFSRIMGTVKSC